MQLLSRKGLVPHKVKAEESTPISVDEGVQMVRAMKHLVVIKNDSIRYQGPTSLPSQELRLLIGNEKTFNLRYPAVFLKKKSTAIIGWSYKLWDSHM